MDVRTMCLGILSRGKASGYEIKKELEEGPLSCLFDAGYGSIYPALKRLQDQGLIEQASTPEDGRADAKYYQITDDGLKDFIGSLQSKKTKDKIKSPVMFAMFFGNLLPNEYLARIQKEYLHFYQDYKINIDTWMEHYDKLSPSEKYIIRMGEAVISAKVKFMEENPIEEFFE